MNYRKKKHTGSAMVIRIVCAIVFILFSWCWLFFFQSDLLTMGQHVLSHGLTHYNRFVGALVITALLYLLQYLVHKFTHLDKSFYALSFFPSMMVLGVLTDIVPDSDGGITRQFPWWLALLYVVLWSGGIFLAHKFQEIDDDPHPHVFSRSMWVNLLFMSGLMMMTAGIGNTDAVFHYRMRAEHCLLEGDVDGALAAGRKSLETDKHLVMLRMAALARQDALGERFFEYKLCGNSKSILPTDGQSTLLLYPADSIYKFLGAVPAYPMEPMHYLQLVQHHVLCKDTVPSKVVADYQLSGYLIDKQIDAFAKEIGKYYQLNDSLPKHYREAMVLYTHLRARPVAVYQNTVLDEDYANFRDLRKQYPNKMEQKGKVMDQYFGTYWYYYFYE